MTIFQTFFRQLTAYTGFGIFKIFIYFHNVIIHKDKHLQYNLLSMNSGIIYTFTNSWHLKVGKILGRLCATSFIHSDYTHS